MRGVGGEMLVFGLNVPSESRNSDTNYRKVLFLGVDLQDAPFSQLVCFWMSKFSIQMEAARGTKIFFNSQSQERIMTSHSDFINKNVVLLFFRQSITLS